MSCSTTFLSSTDAAERLGIAVLTLYEWLSQSDAGEFQIRGRQVSIDYYQGGRRGQGRIRLAEKEVERLQGLMRVSPGCKQYQRSPTRKPKMQHITASLGRPDT
ncbi:hypothetical protein [Blastopirellula marina]|uniref:Molybdenum-pterin-binding protein n=1 Tax=Blastopirellula marina DSM 3645 TaxID=314230 RepID=A3ZSK3_9BACT|nr:hypothetical protein [Blastopirellula marina]EAQ80663.1 hypothetical protein DSM3645_14995 [Blastopirellula marina DSM 3645]